MYTRKSNQLRALSATAETHSKGQTCWTKWRHIPVVLTGISISYINASLTLSVGSSVEDNSLKWWIDHRPGHRHWVDVQRPNPNETKAAPDKGICFSEHPTISSLQKEGPEEFLVMTTLDFNMLLQFPMERQTWWTAVAGTGRHSANKSVRSISGCKFSVECMNITRSQWDTHCDLWGRKTPVFTEKCAENKYRNEISNVFKRGRFSCPHGSPWRGHY